MRFYVCELKSGDLIDEYPLEITQELTTRLKTYGTGEFRLPVLHEQCPASWAEDLVPWRVLIVVTSDDDRIMWAGIPTTRTADGGSPTVTVQAVTCEKYLDRRYMPDAEYEQVEQITIARDMVGVCADDVLGIGLDLETAASGVLRDRSYYNDEDARVLTRLQQLSNVIDGFEWRIDVEWESDDHAGVRKIFRTGYPTIGYVTDDPDLVFEVATGIPGPVTDFTHEAQWSDGDAATLVQAAGDGEGEDKPYSDPVVDGLREAAGWPRLEERQSMSGVIEDDTLNTGAQGMAERLFGGQSVISIDATTTQWPTPADVSLGDTARIHIDTDQLQLDQVWRVVGYSIQPGQETWTPTLAAIGDYGGDDA